jgi:broad specificity phosphatase PhoE
MTRIYFVRHGEARGNVDRNFHGYFDSDLTENGMFQIALLGKAFENINIDVLYSSDLKRTHETAKAIADVKNLKVKTRQELREINGGEWEDVPWDVLPEKFAESYKVWLNTPHLLQLPGGESMMGFSERLWKAVMEIVGLHRGESIGIVTHGTAIRVLMCLFKSLPLEKLNEVKWCDNTAISIIEVADDNSIKIISEGDNSHLGEYGTIEKQKWWKDSYL